MTQGIQTLTDLLAHAGAKRFLESSTPISAGCS